MVISNQIQPRFPLGNGRLEDIPRDSLRAGGFRPSHTVVRLMLILNQIGTLNQTMVPQ